METGQIILLCILILFILVIFKIIYDNKVKQKKLRRFLMENYGKLPNNDYTAGRYDGLACYYNEKIKDRPVIDDITWNDLDLETIFMIMNNTCSGIGEEYLYALLHMPYYEETPLKERDRIISYFDEREEERVNIQMELKKLGKLQNASIGQYLSGIKSMKPHNPAFHIAVLVLLFVTIIGCFIDTAVFVPMLIVMILVNFITYFRYKAKISSYFVVFSYLSRLTQTANDIASQKCNGIKTYNDILLNCSSSLKNISRYSWLFVSGTDFRSDLIALILDYVKMITHFDLIIFDRMVYSIYKYRDKLDQMMDILGEIDADIAIGSYRRYLGDVCKPTFVSNEAPFIHCENVYHPLIINPVKNRIKEEQGVLITGSNASGKSTFLKTMAINAILAQTIYTCLADSWQGNFYRIYSSMALTDNISGNESYYIVEIKSLKRIIDAADIKDDVPVLCFIDEVLRGTNTVERIAASSRILHALNHKNALCFAATHDIELTAILENEYSNYHFKEDVIDHQVIFDYRLRHGRATSRNAIKLLDILGFETKITNEASTAAKDFEEQGFWSIIGKNQVI